MSLEIIQYPLTMLQKVINTLWEILQRILQPLKIIKWLPLPSDHLPEGIDYLLGALGEDTG
jgi:hypothetical protein